MITCPSHSVLRLSLNLPRSLVTVLASTGHDPISLMSVLCCQVAVSLQHLALGQEFLPIPRVVGSDLCCRCAIDSLLAQMVFDLFSSWTGRLQVLFGVAADFRLPMFPAFQFIAEHLQPHCQFGSVNCRHVSLGNEEFVGLEAPRLFSLACSVTLKMTAWV